MSETLVKSVQPVRLEGDGVHDHEFGLRADLSFLEELWDESPGLGAHYHVDPPPGILRAFLKVAVVEVGSVVLHGFVLVLGILVVPTCRGLVLARDEEVVGAVEGLAGRVVDFVRQTSRGIVDI